MKKLILTLLVAVCLAFTAFSQDASSMRNTMDVGPFTRVSVSGKLMVTLQQGDTDMVVARGEHKDNVNAKVVKGELRVSQSVLRGDQTQVTVFHKSPLAQVEASSDAELTSSDEFIQDKLAVICTSGGFIEFSATLTELEVNISAGGQVQINGDAKSQNVIIKAGGRYNGLNLVSEKADVKVTSGGTVDVDVKQELSATITMGGNINYKGNPAHVIQKTNMGGNIAIIE